MKQWRKEGKEKESKKGRMEMRRNKRRRNREEKLKMVRLKERRKGRGVREMSEKGKIEGRWRRVKDRRHRNKNKGDT